jgi:hypothetical protein
MFKKGTQKMSPFAVFAIIGGLIVAVLLMTGNINLPGGAAADSSSAQCTPIYDVTTTTDIGSINEDGDVITLTSSHLDASAQSAITVGLTVSRLDDCSENGYPLSKKVNYKVDGEEFRNQVDTSDSTVYYTVGFDSTNKFNITADGVDFAVKNDIVQDATTPSTPATADVIFAVEDYTTLDKAVVENYDVKTVGTAKVVDLNGKTIKTVVIKYLKD